jgi:hypothetical protein
VNDEERAAFDAEPRGRERMKILEGAWARFMHTSDGRLWRQNFERRRTDALIRVHNGRFIVV